MNKDSMGTAVQTQLDSSPAPLKLVITMLTRKMVFVPPVTSGSILGILLTQERT